MALEASHDSVAVIGLGFMLRCPLPLEEVVKLSQLNFFKAL